MRVYLDACTLQRPLDDRSQPRINVEAEAVLSILSLVEAGDLELLSSEALEFEIAQNPDAERRANTVAFLRPAKQRVEVNDVIEVQAEQFIDAGIKPIDALHLASACWTKADFFCTCDDKLLKKSKKLKSLATSIVTPLQLIAEVTR